MPINIVFGLIRKHTVLLAGCMDIMCHKAGLISQSIGLKQGQPVD